MKKIFTLITAWLLSMTINAQDRMEMLDMAQGTIEKNPAMSTIVPKSDTNKTPPSKIRMDEGERIMGYYDTDELTIYPDNGYLSLGSSGSHPVGDYFNEEVIGNFVGGQIVRFRFALACSAYVSNAFIYPVEQQQIGGEPIVKIDINETLDAGWHDVEMPEAITIEEGMEYVIGFEYTEGPDIYPLATDDQLDVNYNIGYFLYYVNLGSYGYQWAYVERGQLCIQAVVKGGNFPDDDITLSNLSVDKYTSEDKSLNYSLDIRNYGNKYPDSYSLTIAIDGIEKETIETPLSLTGDYQTMYRTLDLGGISTGSHSFTIAVDKINGATPTERTDDDVLEGKFTIYEGETVERQMHLIESFTSIYDEWSPMGLNIIEAIQKNHPDKYAWVSIHSNPRGLSVDTLATSSSTLDIEVFFGIYLLPMATFSRAELTNSFLGIRDEVLVDLYYFSQYTNSVAEAIDEAVDAEFEAIPAFVSVDIAPQYDVNTRELTITVTGTGNATASDLLADNRLTVYLTEDGIEGYQYNFNETTGVTSWMDYTHNNVLRKIVTRYEWGDDIGWTSDSSYENTFSTTLDGKWNADNVYVTAFISGPMRVRESGVWYPGDMNNLVVNNANRVKVTGVEEGISTITTCAEIKTQTFYTIDGRQVSAPQKGVNIIRFADGTVKKIYVK